MAIRIPILTSFDPKGLRQANAQFAKLQGSIGSLGRNFAIAGAAIAGAGAIIAKNAQSLARIERITAQTESVLKSTGTTANGTAKDISNLAGSLENLTATEAETIQEGANLLLTFKNIQNQAGAGNDIFNQTTAAMVDVARAMGTNASTEAIRLGKALNDPIKGISALSRVGIQFTEDQKAQIKALQQSGDLMGAQKIILAELQSQFGGSGAAYAKTFSGQLELMGHELGTIGEEATMAVMPALQGMVEQLRELIPVIGPQLKAAIESVDWNKLTQDVVNLATFFIKNATAIVQVTATIFAINTAFKAMQVVMGLVQVALALKTWWLAKVATGMTTAAIATGAFSTALKLIPFVAIAAGIGLIITGITEADSSYRTTTPVVTSFGQEVLKTGYDAEWAAGRYGVATTAVKNFNSAISSMPTVPRIDIPTVGGGRGLDLSGIPRSSGGGGFTAGQIASAPKTGGGGSQNQTVEQAIKQGTVAANREAKLLGTGISSGFASLILSKVTGKTSFQKELGKLTKTTESATKAQARFNKTSAGIAEVAANAAAASAAAAEAASQFAAAQEAAARAAQEAADREAAIVAERERVFQSFSDSVKNTFAGIKNSILGAFDLTQLGGSTNAITRNMEKLLTRLRSFATNVKSLAGMGLDPALLQQVISAGPMAGARLAESLVMGGTGALAAINAGYSEFGMLSGQIAQTGTESLFNRESQQTVYNINVDGGVGSGSTIGKAIVDAIKAYERTSGAVWQGA
jgi:hypothetical protein